MLIQTTSFYYKSFRERLEVDLALISLSISFYSYSESTLSETVSRLCDLQSSINNISWIVAMIGRGAKVLSRLTFRSGSNSVRIWYWYLFLSLVDFFPTFFFLIFSILFSFILFFLILLKLNFFKLIESRVKLESESIMRKSKADIRNCAWIFCWPAVVISDNAFL